MGHRMNSSLCAGFIVFSHSHGTIQVITWNHRRRVGYFIYTSVKTKEICQQHKKKKKTDTIKTQ